MKRHATALWTGDLASGNGRLQTGSKTLDGTPYSFASRFEDGGGTNPEELLGAAHAGCFSMALSAALANAGHTPTRVETTATVHLVKGEQGLAITRIDLATRGAVPGLSAEEFQRLAEATKTGCIVSRALSAVPMELTATLEPA